MILTILGLILFMTAQSVLLYLAFTVGKGTITEDVIEPTKRAVQRVKKSVVKETIQQHEIYDPTEHDEYRNEKELEEQANEQIDGALITLKNLKEK